MLDVAGVGGRLAFEGIGFVSCISCCGEVLVEVGAGMMMGVITTTTITAMVMEVHVRREHLGKSA